jgi:hypothetical protein
VTYLKRLSKEEKQYKLVAECCDSFDPQRVLQLLLETPPTRPTPAIMVFQMLCTWASLPLSYDGAKLPDLLKATVLVSAFNFVISPYVRMQETEDTDAYTDLYLDTLSDSIGYQIKHCIAPFGGFQTILSQSPMKDLLTELRKYRGRAETCAEVAESILRIAADGRETSVNRGVHFVAQRPGCSPARDRGELIQRWSDHPCG